MLAQFQPIQHIEHEILNTLVWNEGIQLGAMLIERMKCQEITQPLCRHFRMSAAAEPFLENNAQLLKCHRFTLPVLVRGRGWRNGRLHRVFRSCETLLDVHNLDHFYPRGVMPVMLCALFAVTHDVFRGHGAVVQEARDFLNNGHDLRFCLLGALTKALNTDPTGTVAVLETANASEHIDFRSQLLHLPAIPRLSCGAEGCLICLARRSKRRCVRCSLGRLRVFRLCFIVLFLVWLVWRPDRTRGCIRFP